MTQVQASSARSREDRRAQLLRAAAKRASLRHPHVLPARLVDGDEGRTRLVLRPCSSPSLRTVLERGPLSTKNAVALVVGLAGAVDAFARGGLVARELTPDAVLVDRRRGAILTDYGMPPGLVGPMTGRRDANAAYRSPEERDGRELTARSSVYSLGAILVSALTAAPPPEHLRPQQARRTRDVPPTIESVIAQAMAADPSRRYANVTEMACAAVEVVRAGERIGRMGAPKVRKEKPLRAVSWSAAQKRGSGGPKLVVPATALEDAEAATRRKRNEAAQRKAAQEAERREKAEQAGRRKREQAAAKREQDAAAKRARDAAAQHKREQAAAKRERDAATKRAREQAAAKRKREQEARRKAGAEAKRNGAPTTRRRGASEAGPQRKPRRGTAEKSSASVTATSARATARIPKPTIDLGAVQASLGRHRRPLVGVALVSLVAGAAAASTLALTAGHDGEARAVPIAAADLSIRLPAGWERGAPQIAGLDWLSGTVGGAASDERNSALVTGLISEPGAAGRGLRALLPDGASAKTVRLGRLEAKRYSNLSLGSGMAGTAYLVHTTGPSLAIVCRSSSATAAGFARQCAEAASTVRLRGERAVSPAIAARRPLLVRRALRTLSAERAEGRRRVAAALVADDQAKASRGLQASYLQAAGRVDLTGAYGQRIEALSAALHEASYGYGALAESINAGDQRAYDAARVVVIEAETQVWGKSAAN